MRYEGDQGQRGSLAGHTATGACRGRFQTGPAGRHHYWGGLLGGGTQGQHHIEASALTGGGLRPDAPTVQAHDLAADVEAQAVTADDLRTAPAVGPLKDTWQVFRRDAHAGITHAELRGALDD